MRSHWLRAGGTARRPRAGPRQPAGPGLAPRAAVLRPAAQRFLEDHGRTGRRLAGPRLRRSTARRSRHVASRCGMFAPRPSVRAASMRRSATQRSWPTTLRRFSGRIAKIRLICFNGRKAADLYRRFVLPGLPTPCRPSAARRCRPRALLTPRCASSKSSRGGPSCAAIDPGNKKPRPLPAGAAGDLVEAAGIEPASASPTFQDLHA